MSTICIKLGYGRQSVQNVSLSNISNILGFCIFNVCPPDSSIVYSFWRSHLKCIIIRYFNFLDFAFSIQFKCPSLTHQQCILYTLELRRLYFATGNIGHAPKHVSSWHEFIKQFCTVTILFGLALLVNFCRHLATIQCRNRCPTCHAAKLRCKKIACRR